MDRRLGSRLLLAVAWVLSLAPYLAVADAPEVTPATETALQAKLTKKLRTIIIAKIDFENSSLSDVLRFLTLESKRSDPAHEGVHFVVDLPEGTPPPKPVTLQLNNVTLQEAIRYSLCLADQDLRYRVEGYVVSIRYSTEDPLLISRNYIVPKGFFVSSDENAEQQLADKGVKFPPKASATYLPKTITLEVVNTPDQMELVEELIVGSMESNYPVSKHSLLVPINQINQ